MSSSSVAGPSNPSTTSNTQKHKATHRPAAGDAIVFEYNNIEPDTRMLVFGKELHVHSSVISQNSKQLGDLMKYHVPAPEDAEFQYEYVAVADDNVDADYDDNVVNWGLESAARVAENGTVLRASEELEINGRVFAKLVGLWYKQPVVFDSGDDVAILPKLAEFYNPQPDVPFSLDTLLSADLGLSDTIHNEPLSFLIAGYRLQHPVLFREALIHVVAQWDKDHRRQPARWKDTLKMYPGLYYAVKSAHEWTDYYIADVGDLINCFAKDDPVIHRLHNEAWKSAFGETQWKTLRKDRLVTGLSRWQHSGSPKICYYPTLSHAKYYRYIWDKLNDEDEDNEGFYDATLFERLQLIMKNKLYWGADKVVGAGDCTNRMLCASLNDENLPWLGDEDEDDGDDDEADRGLGWDRDLAWAACNL